MTTRTNMHQMHKPGPHTNKQTNVYNHDYNHHRNTAASVQVTLHSGVSGFPAERLSRSRAVKGTTVQEGVRDSWESSIHLDGRPVDRFDVSSSKPTRSHHFTKAGKGSRSHPVEDVGKIDTWGSLVKDSKSCPSMINFCFTRVKAL